MPLPECQRVQLKVRLPRRRMDSVSLPEPVSMKASLWSSVDARVRLPEPFEAMGSVSSRIRMKIVCEPVGG